MEPILQRAEEVLHRHPSPTMPLPELHRRLEARGRVPPAHQLLELLARHPQRFRVLDAWPLDSVDGGQDAPPTFGERQRRVRLRPAPCAVRALAGILVMALDPPDPAEAQTAGGRLRESLRWMVRRSDARSRVLRLRVYRLALEEAEARRRLEGRAA